MRLMTNRRNWRRRKGAFPLFDREAYLSRPNISLFRKRFAKKLPKAASEMLC